ncbi:MAG: addiction module antitoxin [Gammaproteobacteria bacterium]|nr:addiction module antitoxin [Gammaproteobacteria bacterium]
MAKEVQMSIKLESDLRAQFMLAATHVHRPAAQIIREMMRAFIAEHMVPNAETVQAIEDVESGKVNTYKNAAQMSAKI